MSALMSTLLTLVDEPPVEVDPSTGKGPEWGKASPVGLLVILLLAIATFFLLRSMTRRLKRVPKSFDPPDGPDASPAVLTPAELRTTAEPATPTASASGDAGPPPRSTPALPAPRDDRSG